MHPHAGTNEEFEELLTGWLDGTLTPDEQARFDALCSGNPEWKVEAEEQRALVDDLRAMPRVMAPAGLLEEALRQAREPESTARIEEVIPTPAARRSTGMWIGLAAAMAAVVGVGALIMKSTEPAQRPDTMDIAMMRDEAAPSEEAPAAGREMTLDAVEEVERFEALSMGIRGEPQAASIADDAAPAPARALDKVAQATPAPTSPMPSPTPLARTPRLAPSEPDERAPTIGALPSLIITDRHLPESRFQYDPTNGTVSRGDTWRARNGEVALAEQEETPTPEPVTLAFADEMEPVGAPIPQDHAQFLQMLASTVDFELKDKMTALGGQITELRELNFPFSSVEAAEAFLAAVTATPMPLPQTRSASRPPSSTSTGAFRSSGFATTAPTQPGSMRPADFSADQYEITRTEDAETGMVHVIIRRLEQAPTETP